MKLTPAQVVKVLRGPGFGLTEKEALLKGDTVVVRDSFYYEGEKRMRSMEKSWSKGGIYYKYFADEYGIGFRVVDRSFDFTGGTMYGKRQKGGVAEVQLKVVPLNEDRIPGGKGDDADPRDVDQRQLAVGIEVEREHTSSEEEAREIALDHLTENPEYYSELVRAGLVDEKGALDKYEELFGAGDVSEGRLRRGIRALIEAEQVKAGRATLEDKLGGLLGEGEAAALRRLLPHMSDDTALQLGRANGQDVTRFIDNVRKMLS